MSERKTMGCLIALIFLFICFSLMFILTSCHSARGPLAMDDDDCYSDTRIEWLDDEANCITREVCPTDTTEWRTCS